MPDGIYNNEPLLLSNVKSWAEYLATLLNMKRWMPNPSEETLERYAPGAVKIHQGKQGLRDGKSNFP